MAAAVAAAEVLAVPADQAPIMVEALPAADPEDVGIGAAQLLMVSSAAPPALPRRPAQSARSRRWPRDEEGLWLAPGTASGYKGVCRILKGKTQKIRFRVEVQVDGRKKKLGYFLTPKDAARRYARFVEETQAETFD